MKKLLFYLTRYPGVAGIENVTSLIVSRLCQEYMCDIVSHIQDDNDIVQSVPEHVTIHKLPDNGYDTKANRNAFRALLSAGKYNLVIYQDSYAPTERLVVDICREVGVPFVVFEHNSPLFVESKRTLEPWYCSCRSLFRRLLHPVLLRRERRRKLMLLESAKCYVLLSKAFFADFERIANVPVGHPKLLAINNPAPPILRANSCASVVGNDNKRNILYVGRLEREKRVDMIIEIWSRICNVIPEWTLTIVGDGTQRAKLEKMASNVPRISFEGFQNPTTYYQCSSIFLMTSKFEGWGMTLVEAMQYGVVPIAMNTFSALTDIIDNGVNGIILSPKESIDSCADIVQALARNPEKLGRMGAMARTKVQRFSLDNIIMDWKRMLDELIG